MARTPFSLPFIAALAAFAGFGLGACGDTSTAGPADEIEGGAAGTAAIGPAGADNTGGGRGGATGGSAGGASQPPEVGGQAGASGIETGGTMSAGGHATSAGGQATAGGSPGAAGASAGSGQGGAGSSGTALAFCPRLSRPVDLADLVRRDYFVAILSDCRVAGMIRNRSSELTLFSNAFVKWNFRFWGCSIPAVETEFGLAYRAEALTTADAQLLVELYLPVVTRDLSLSTSEVSAIRGELERLAEAAVLDPSEDEFSMSVCESPPGGAGGAGGAAGAGGESGSGGLSGGNAAGTAGGDAALGGAGSAGAAAGGLGSGAAGA